MKTTQVYLVELRRRTSDGDIRVYLSVDKFRARFPSAQPTFVGRLAQIRQLCPAAIDWEMVDVERPDLPPFDNEPCLKCRAPRYRCSC